MISRVGHVGIRVPNLSASIDHAERTLGLRLVERRDGVAYLTCNQRHHELVLLESHRPACDHLAFEVEGGDDLEEIQSAVARKGLQIISDLPEEPGLARAFRFIGPGGFTFEIFQGMAIDEPREYSTVGIRPDKFEHITIKAAEKDAMESFLQDSLGFRLSDRAGDAISWWRCNAEHHGVSVIRSSENLLQHYAWQIRDWSVIARTGDHLAGQGRTFLWGPGHHGIGDNYFCYFLDADGVIVEYSANMQRIESESTYRPRTWPDTPLSVNRWGNPAPPDEFLAGGIPGAE